MKHSLFSSIGGCDALLKGAHRYGPIGENERQAGWSHSHNAE